MSTIPTAAYTSSPAAVDARHAPEVERRVDVLLSVGRALLGQVYDNLRAVSYEEDGEMLRFHFFTLDEPSEEDVETSRCITTEVISDFAAPARIDETFQAVPFPRPLPRDKGECAFRRKRPRQRGA